jgi:hypothetical protein
VRGKTESTERLYLFVKNQAELAQSFRAGMNSARIGNAARDLQINFAHLLTPKLLKRKSADLATQFVPGSRKLYNTLIILVHCLDIISPDHHWRSRFKSLISTHPIAPRIMGFPQDWASRPIWNKP